VRIVVAGSAGFIGYELCAQLLAAGHEVVGVDDLSTGQQRNVDDLRAERGFSFLQASITSPVDVPGDVNGVYNVACPASPVDFDTKRRHILATCSRGVENLLDFARAKGARFLQASTSEVYGDPQVHPQVETYWGYVNPIGPRSCYDEGKRFAEALIYAYQRDFDLPVRVARIFNTYGPRMRPDDGRILPNFIMQALAGKPLSIHGDGKQTRSFCYVSDLVDGLIRLMESDVTEPVNLGSTDEITVLEFANEILRLCGERSKISYVPRPADDPNIRRPDITRARRLLGWEARVSREEGLRRSVEWFRGLDLVAPDSGS